LFGGDLVAIDRFVAAIPDRENDAPLGGAVDLHSEVPPVPAAGHVEGGHRFLDRGHLAVKGGYGIGRGLVAEVDGRGIAAFLEVEVGAFESGTVEDEGLELPGVQALGIERFESEVLIAGAFDRKRAKVGGEWL
jgi:hypothetical protein